MIYDIYPKKKEPIKNETLLNNNDIKVGKMVEVEPTRSTVLTKAFSRPDLSGLSISFFNTL